MAADPEQHPRAWQEAPACCASRRLVPAMPTTATVSRGAGFQAQAVSGMICLGCGHGIDGAGTSWTLAPDELKVWQERWKRRDAAKAAVSAGAGVSVTETTATFPDPFWLPSMGLCTPLTKGALLSCPDASQIRVQLRGIYRSDDKETARTITTILGPITVDNTYFDHLYEVDPKTGKDRIDEDHIAYATLTTHTLAKPLEVYEQQPGGKKTRKRIYLALYQIDSSYIYHAVVVIARGCRLLTAYRINGGKTSFVGDRHGVPLYVGY